MIYLSNVPISFMSTQDKVINFEAMIWYTVNYEILIFILQCLVTDYAVLLAAEIILMP